MVGGSAFNTEAGKVAASTEAIGKAGASANKAASASALTLSAAGSKLQSTGSKLSSIGRTMTAVGIPLAAVAGYSMKAAASFQQNMTLLSTQANESRANLSWMSKDALTMAKQMGVLPNDIAQGLYAFESVGVHGKQAMQDMKAAIMGTKVGLDALPQTTDAISTVMASHIKGAGGPIQAMALMDAAIGQGKMHLADLTDSFKSSIVPMSQTFGVSFPQILSGIASLSGVGVPPEEAANRMKLMYTSMVAPTGAGAKALAKAGLGTDDLGAALRSPGGLPAALELLQTHLANFSPGDRNQILAATFGRSRGMGQITALLNQLPQMEKIYGNVMRLGNAPTLTQHYDQSQATDAAKLAKAHANLDASMVKLGTTLNQKLLPLLPPLVNDASKVLEAFGHLPRPIQEVALGFGALTIVGGPMAMFAGNLFKLGGTVLGAVGKLGSLATGAEGAASGFVELIPLVVAAAGAYEIWTHRKQIAQGLSSAGRSTGNFVVGGLHSAFGVLGSANEANLKQSYLTGREFKSYAPIIQADIEGLMNPKSYQANHLGKVYSDMASWGKNVNLNDIPGISQAVKQAIKEGMKESKTSVYLPNGRLLAQTVNEVNRRNQNRK